MDADFHESIAAARTGDAKALDGLFGRHLSVLRAFVRVKVGPGLLSRESVDDLVQSVCREVVQDLDQFEYRGERAFRAWLFKMACRKIVDRHRYNHRERRSPDREEPWPQAKDGSGEAEELLTCYSMMCTPSRDASAREEVARIEAVLQQLPEDQREAVSMSRMMNLSYGEIATVMSRSEASVRGLVARGLAHLAEYLDAEQ